MTQTLDNRKPVKKYCITIDTSWAMRAYEEIVVEAETAAKANYKACKIFYGNVFNRESMKYFITLFHANAEQVPDNTPLTRKYYEEKHRYEYGGAFPNINFELVKEEETK